MKLILSTMLTLALVPLAVRANCQFPINILEQISPVPVLNRRFIRPSGTGMIHIPTCHSLELFCSTKFRTYVNSETITVTCLPNGQFKFGNIFNLLLTSPQLQCAANNIKNDLKFAAPDTFRLGYTISGNFFQLIDLRFTAAAKRTIYAHHQVEPVAANAQQRVTSSFSNSFRADTQFSSTDDNLYSYYSQRDTICNKTLALKTDSQCDALFEKNRRFLARGHLAPSADFIYLAAKRATYSLLNVAPQWQQLNNGPWKAIEAGVRARSFDRAAVLDVFTGTLGTLALSGSGAKKKRLFLDESRIRKIPVPEVFYKVVVDAAASRGVVFLAHNNPYASDADVQAVKLAVGCADVANRMTWPRLWFDGSKRLNRTQPAFRSTGYVWACEVRDFASRLLDLPVALKTTAYQLLN